MCYYLPMTTDTRQPDPLYEALVKYEDASNTVGSLTIVTQGAYRQLTDAISGHGDLALSLGRFQFEAALLADAHNQWNGRAQELAAQVADGIEWQRGLGNPFEEVARQPYGERAVLATEQL